MCDTCFAIQECYGFMRSRCSELVHNVYVILYLKLFCGGFL